MVNREASIMRPIRPAALGTRVEASIRYLPTSRHTIPLGPRKESHLGLQSLEQLLAQNHHDQGLIALIAWATLPDRGNATPMRGRPFAMRCLTSRLSVLTRTSSP